MWKSRAVPVEDKENFFSSERIPFGGGIVHTPLVKTTLVELSEIPLCGVVVYCLYSGREAYAGIRISLGTLLKKLLDKAE